MAQYPQIRFDRDGNNNNDDADDHDININSIINKTTWQR